MKNTNSKRTRFLALCIIAALLAICLASVLVACGDKNDSNKPNGDESENIISIVEKMIAYALTNSTEENSFEIGGELYNSTNYKSDASFFLGTGSIGYINIFFGKSEEEEEWNEFYLLISDNAANAEQNIALIKEDMPETAVITQLDNIVISESRRGIYNEILQATMPSENAISEKTMNFMKTGLSSFSSEDTDNIHFAMAIEKSSLLYYGCYITPMIGNCSVCYEYYSSDTVDEDELSYDIEKIATYCTDDSYIKAEDDGVYVYRKEKPMMLFEENYSNDGYLLSYYRFDTVEGGNLVIPEAYNGRPVTGFYGYVDGHEKVVSISLPKTVTDRLDFGGWGDLKSITVDSENPMYYIEGNCLIRKSSNEDGDCYTVVRGFDNSIIPTDERVTHIADNAFYRCEFTAIVIPKNITSIGMGAFSWCRNLTSIIIPKTVIEMSYDVFSGCTRLETVYCEAEEKPETWYNWLGWNVDAEIVWGYHADEQE